MFRIVFSYVRFLWRSTNEHGVHSPFVFLLLTQCFYDRTKYPSYTTLTRYRKTLLRDGKTIEVTDLGAGSKVFQSNRRKVSAIAKNAGISAKRAALLYRISQYLQPKNTLEMGTSLGLATSALSLGNPNGHVISLEGCPETAKTARVKLAAFGLNNIQIIATEFDGFLLDLPQNCTFDLIYFDGNHSKEATLAYFEKLLPTVTNHSVWIFDDIHWSTGMEAAWATLKQNPAVTVTIDTFQWGLVFFRREQAKEHFTIRA